MLLRVPTQALEQMGQCLVGQSRLLVDGLVAFVLGQLAPLCEITEALCYRCIRIMNDGWAAAARLGLRPVNETWYLRAAQQHLVEKRVVGRAGAKDARLRQDSESERKLAQN